MIEQHAMTFFIPDKSPEEAERLYEATRKFAAGSWAAHGEAIDDARIQSITFRDRGGTVRAEVGQLDPCEGKVVMAILRTSAEVKRYLICTANRGVFRGDPIVVEDHEVSRVEPFDP
jgi:hypothetical protein